ncbi:MAG: hypothetical protein QNK23_07220 [Crocinitomicaceae bacterium]|nr:hypothetical protein [Crocinitomicaceae bacterium]
MSEDKNSHEAKIRFNMRSKEFEISGNESFVTDQIENFKELIQGSLGKLVIDDSPRLNGDFGKYQILPEPVEEVKSEDVKFVESNKTIEKKEASIEYENVLVIDEDRVKVIADVPGDTTASKMINVILIYMWAKLQLGVEEISFDELRSICEEYGEVDKKNFSTRLKDKKKLFLINGTSRAFKAKLIRPGILKAETLLKKLNG